MKIYRLNLNARVANKEDFADELGNKKYGTVYAHLNKAGDSEDELHIFSVKTNLQDFKLLYFHEQILIPMGIFEFKDSQNEKIQ